MENVSERKEISVVFVDLIRLGDDIVWKFPTGPRCVLNHNNTCAHIGSSSGHYAEYRKCAHAYCDGQCRQRGGDNWTGEFLRCRVYILHRHSSSWNSAVDQRRNCCVEASSGDWKPQL